MTRDKWRHIHNGRVGQTLGSPLYNYIVDKLDTLSPTSVSLLRDYVLKSLQKSERMKRRQNRRMRILQTVKRVLPPILTITLTVASLRPEYQEGAIWAGLVISTIVTIADAFFSSGVEKSVITNLLYTQLETQTVDFLTHKNLYEPYLTNPERGVRRFTVNFRYIKDWYERQVLQIQKKDNNKKKDKNKNKTSSSSSTPNTSSSASAGGVGTMINAPGMDVKVDVTHVDKSTSTEEDEEEEEDMMHAGAPLEGLTSTMRWTESPMRTQQRRNAVQHTVQHGVQHVDNVPLRASPAQRTRSYASVRSRVSRSPSSSRSQRDELTQAVPDSKMVALAETHVRSAVTPTPSSDHSQSSHTVTVGQADAEERADMFPAEDEEQRVYLAPHASFVSVAQRPMSRAGSMTMSVAGSVGLPGEEGASVEGSVDD
jgi:hypothetical protein